MRPITPASIITPSSTTPCPMQEDGISQDGQQCAFAPSEKRQGVQYWVWIVVGVCSFLLCCCCCLGLAFLYRWVGSSVETPHLPFKISPPHPCLACTWARPCEHTTLTGITRPRSRRRTKKSKVGPATEQELEKGAEKRRRGLGAAHTPSPFPHPVPNIPPPHVDARTWDHRERDTAYRHQGVGGWVGAREGEGALGT